MPPQLHRKNEAQIHTTAWSRHHTLVRSDSTCVESQVYTEILAVGDGVFSGVELSSGEPLVMAT